jgi:hypothetical protein
MGVRPSQQASLENTRNFGRSRRPRPRGRGGGQILRGVISEAADRPLSDVEASITNRDPPAMTRLGGRVVAPLQRLLSEVETVLVSKPRATSIRTKSSWLAAMVPQREQRHGRFFLYLRARSRVSKSATLRIHLASPAVNCLHAGAQGLAGAGCRRVTHHWHRPDMPCHACA